MRRSEVYPLNLLLAEICDAEVPKDIARYAREKKRIMILNGWTPLEPPIIPSRMTLQGIHWDAFSRKTISIGAVARFNEIDKRRLRVGVLERGIRGRGIDTA
jgi:hypothetical protein